MARFQENDPYGPQQGIHRFLLNIYKQVKISFRRLAAAIRPQSFTSETTKYIWSDRIKLDFINVLKTQRERNHPATVVTQSHNRYYTIQPESLPAIVETQAHTQCHSVHNVTKLHIKQ